MEQYEYKYIRPDIRSGDLLAFSCEGWRSYKEVKTQLIRVFTRSEYSHVGVAWVIGGRVMIIEAVIPMVRIYPLSKVGDFYHIPLSANWDEEIERKAISYVGNPYKQLKAIQAFFTNLKKNSTEECAALAITISGDAGIDLGERATPDSVVKTAQQLGFPLFFVKNSHHK